MLEHGKEIILDLLIDNFDEYTLKKEFRIDKNLTLNFSERVIYIVQNILAGNERYIETLILHNNSYIKRNGYGTLKREELILLFENDRIKGMHGEGIKSEQMLLFALTTGERKEDIEFFEEQYHKFLKEVLEKKKESLAIAPQLDEALQGTSFEMEFQGFVQNQYKGFDSMNFEQLGRKYGLQYNEHSDTFKVPSGFIAFFDSKTLEYHNKLEVFQLNFGLLHGNLVRVNKYIENLKQQEEGIEEVLKENKKLKKENGELEQKNAYYKAQNSMLEQQEKEKTILSMSKEISRLETQILKLKKLIQDMEEDEQLEIVEDIRIDETQKDTRKDLTGLNVKIVGGKWNSRTKGEVEELADVKGFQVEFVKADEIFRNSVNLKNSDLIIFDTSYNSHSG